jgi:hypothetical protein
MLIALLGAAAPRALAASPSRHALAVMDPVTIKITTTGTTVWGTVKAYYTVNGARVNKSCVKTKCTIKAPQGVALHLKQTPTNSSTWPFQDWKLTSGGNTKTVAGSSTSFKVKGKSTVTAVYVLGMLREMIPTN